MANYLNFNKQEKGYTHISPSITWFKEHIGTDIVYVCRKDVDDRRGYVFPRYGKIYSVRYNTIYFDADMARSIDKRDILEMGIKDDENV